MRSGWTRGHCRSDALLLLCYCTLGSCVHGQLTCSLACPACAIQLTKTFIMDGRCSTQAECTPALCACPCCLPCSAQVRQQESRLQSVELRAKRKAYLESERKRKEEDAAKRWVITAQGLPSASQHVTANDSPG